MKLKNLITYGCGNSLKLDKFGPIQNTNFVKPKGGLWASPMNAHYGWKDWCVAESFGDLNSEFTFGIDGNVLKIDGINDLNKMPWFSVHRIFEFPDFEKMVQDGIDAIWLTEDGQWNTRMIYPHNLYGWDCETVLVMNPNCILV